MGELKYSQKADAVGNLYRAALFLARGNKEQAITMLERANQTLSPQELGKAADLLTSSADKLTSQKKEKYWAEVILDQQKQLSRKYFK